MYTRNWHYSLPWTDSTCYVFLLLSITGKFFIFSDYVLIRFSSWLMAAFNSFFLNFRVAGVSSGLVTNSKRRTSSNFVISSVSLTIVRSTRFLAWQVFLVGAILMLEGDESGSATCWSKDNDDDDATIVCFEDFASWHAGRISTSGSVCSAVLILDVDTEGFDFFQKEGNTFFWRFCIPSCFHSVTFSQASFFPSGLFLIVSHNTPWLFFVLFRVLN